MKEKWTIFCSVFVYVLCFLKLQSRVVAYDDAKFSIWFIYDKKQPNKPLISHILGPSTVMEDKEKRMHAKTFPSIKEKRRREVMGGISCLFVLSFSRLLVCLIASSWSEMTEASMALPKFGEWDVNDPNDYSFIFDKARKERRALREGITGDQPESPGGRKLSFKKRNADRLGRHPSGKKWLCCVSPVNIAD